VSTVTDVAPILNWIYVDIETHELKYGIRLEAQPNLTGPFDCTRQDRRLTFDGWEGFCAVEDIPGLWSIYFDVNDNGLRGKVPPGTRVLEIELSRVEKRFKRDVEERKKEQTTLHSADEPEKVSQGQPVTIVVPTMEDEEDQDKTPTKKPQPTQPGPSESVTSLTSQAASGTQTPTEQHMTFNGEQLRFNNYHKRFGTILLPRRSSEVLSPNSQLSPTEIPLPLSSMSSFDELRPILSPKSSQPILSPKSSQPALSRRSSGMLSPRRSFAGSIAGSIAESIAETPTGQLSPMSSRDTLRSYPSQSQPQQPPQSPRRF